MAEKCYVALGRVLRYAQLARRLACGIAISKIGNRTRLGFGQVTIPTA